MSLLTLFEKLSLFQKNMNKSNIMKDKQEIIKSYILNDSDFVTSLEWVYNPNLKFHLTASNLKKYRNEKNEIKSKEKRISRTLSSEHLFDLLKALSERKITGNKALLEMSRLLDEVDEERYQDLLYCILNKNLEIRCNINTLKKYIPQLSELDFPVSLASNYTEKMNMEITRSKCNWYLSRKLDGIRCLIFKTKEKGVQIVTRSNKAISTLSLLKEELKQGISENFTDFILDGEIVVQNEKGQESFKDVMTEIKRKDHVMSNFTFCCFDYIPLCEFKADNKNGLLFSERQSKLKDIFSTKEWKYVRILEQYLYSNETLEEMKTKAMDENWEGLMLRKNSIYRGKRTKDLLKIKSFHDKEFTVTKIVSGPFRVIDNDEKIEKTIVCLSSIVIELDDKSEVHVGSGFSLEERKRYYQNPETLIGKRVTIKYFEETKSSLRFPVFKGIREDD